VTGISKKLVLANVNMHIGTTLLFVVTGFKQKFLACDPKKIQFTDEQPKVVRPTNTFQLQKAFLHHDGFTLLYCKKSNAPVAILHSLHSITDE